MAICIINIYTKYVQNYIKLLSYDIYIYIYIVVGVLTMHDAWDIIVEVSLPCNQLKSNTCKAKEPCMLISPKDQDLDIQSPSSTSPLPWLSQTNRTFKNLSFPTGPCKNLNSHFTFVSFSLKEGARKLPWVFLSSPPVHTPKKKDKTPPKSPLFISFSWLRQTESPALFLLSFFFVFVFFSLCSHTAASSLSPKILVSLKKKLNN